MADSLYFKAARTVTKHTGTDLTLVNPKRGGNTHLFPQWWDKKGQVQYLDCAIFNVSYTNGDIRLVIPIDPESTELDIRYADNGDFTFPYYRAVDRVAVVAADSTELLFEYQFSKISGGAVLKRTVGALPAPPDPD